MSSRSRAARRRTTFADDDEDTLSQYHPKKKPLSLGRVSKRAVLSSKRKVRFGGDGAIIVNDGAGGRVWGVTAVLVVPNAPSRASFYKQIWDSNDASIDAAQTAVDHWENAYTAMRGLLVASVHSASGLYGAAKTGVTGLEHGLLVPVRDWVLLPAFQGVEHTYSETSRFLQSPKAAQVAQGGLQIVRQAPFIGEPFLAPAIVQSYLLAVRAWEIAQYPIPSKIAVRESVDRVLTMTKWALSAASTEILFYLKRLDANITRTLMHTRWKVLGSGPYATLDKLNKVEVLDHLCERYLSLEDMIARYEFAAHIRAQNAHLYKDLVLSGLLRTRGGDATKHDEWLAACPSYRFEGHDLAFFMPDNNDYDSHTAPKAVPLYFRLPYVNGKRPGKDAPWQRFPEPERRALEKRFLEVCREQHYQNQQESYLQQEELQDQHPPAPSADTAYPTVAQWYRPDLDSDVLVDQKRQAVAFFACCPKCRQAQTVPPILPVTSNFCSDCIVHMEAEEGSVFPPAVSMLLRPTMWRFHGPGDEVRRAVWILDTKRHGLQPYSEESAAVLEDAYWFLRWKSNNETALLTIQVTSPDGSEQQLVQFSSLYRVTAIQKTLGSAISLFKRRVYRGVSLKQVREQQEADIEQPFEESFHDAENEELWVDCANEPPASIGEDDVLDIENLYFEHEPSTIIHKKNENQGSLLAFPATELDLEDEMDRAKSEDNVDHLVLIVHGIGEMLRSADLFGIYLPNLSSIIECCGYLRKNHAEVEKVQSSLASVNGRVEYLPVEWHEAFALQSQRQPMGADENPTERSSSSQTSMNDISLRTIPNMRAFANDTLLDVLYFMSPQHHDLIIDIVTNEMNSVVQQFRNLTGFEGNISVIGHSLGSVITWDILDHQVAPPEVYSPETYSPPVCSDDFAPVGHVPLSVHTASQSPRSNSSSYPQLSFRAQNVFFLGSPIAVFLMIRNQHKPLNSEFHLVGCKNVFNIFHPYDPVAYRIEPLIDRFNADVEPRIVTHWNGGFRVQYQTKRIWKKFVDETMKTQQHVIEVVEAQMTAVGLLDSSIDYMGEDEEFSDSASDSDAPRRPVCGFLNQGRRIDYMLQEKEIESANEYVAALNAHSAYWSEKDLSLFVARQIVRSGLEAAIQDSDEAGYLSSPLSSTV